MWLACGCARVGMPALGLALGFGLWAFGFGAVGFGFGIAFRVAVLDMVSTVAWLEMRTCCGCLDHCGGQSCPG